MQFVLFSTKQGNCYLYSPKIRKFLLLHPLSYFLLSLHKKGRNLGELISSIKKSGMDIDGCGKYTKKDLLYHVNKISFLKQNNFLDNIDTRKSLSFRLKADDIKKSLANTNSCTLEVTQNCCFDCLYCAYGKFYNDYEKRENKNLDISTAKNFIEYLSSLWNSPLNVSYNKKISFGFYGGEPLLNFPLINTLVKYLLKNQSLHNLFSFHITTNAILLNKYIDFLVYHDFDVLISLDGNKENNSYRVFPDGNSSFNEVLKNIQFVKNKYPNYFKKKINFNAVLHNRNSRGEIYKYFKLNFDKIPNISTVAPIGINPLEKRNFQTTFKNTEEVETDNQNMELIERDELKGKYENLANLLHGYSGYIFKKYADFSDNRDEEQKTKIPSGSCIPFSRKIFLTATGKILPCERVGHQFSLGSVNRKNVFIDFNEIAEKYNAYFEKISNLCTQCYNSQQCAYCVFHLDIMSDDFRCDGFMDYHDFSEYLSRNFSILETDSRLYKKIIKGNVFI